MSTCHRNRRQFLNAAAGFCLATPFAANGAEWQKDVPWLSETQKPPKSLVKHELPRIIAKEATLAEWNRLRPSIRRRWLEYLRPSPRPNQAPQVKLIDEERVGQVIRQRIRYESEPGWETEAYLLKPAETKATRRPGVVVFHSTVNHSIRQPAGVEGKPEKAFGLRLANRGFVTLCPRNFLWPDNHHIDTATQTAAFGQRHPSSKGMAKMLRDAQVAVDILLAVPEVDPLRVAAVGHSLGAKEVLYLAAFDQRVRTTVSSEGGIGTSFSNWDAPWYLGPDIRDFAAMHEHHELLALVAPRPFLLIGGQSADGDRSWPYIDAALEIYRLYEGVPRIGLFNHRQGHAVPPIAERRIYQWLETYLK